MFFQGMAGMSRRMYDGGLTYADVPATAGSPGIPGLSPFVLGLNRPILWPRFAWGCRKFRSSSISSGASATAGRSTSDNPWDATTLEWQTPTPPPHGNFAKPMEVFRGPYEYSVPGEARDFITQNEPDQAQPLTHGNPVRS